MTLYVIYQALYVSDDPRQDQSVTLVDIALSHKGAVDRVCDFLVGSDGWVQVEPSRWTYEFDAFESLDINGPYGKAKGRSITIIERKALP